MVGTVHVVYAALGFGLGVCNGCLGPPLSPCSKGPFWGGGVPGFAHPHQGYIKGALQATTPHVALGIKLTTAIDCNTPLNHKFEVP